MVRILFILLLALPMNALSQNLVPNGSFECGEDLCIPVQLYNIDTFSKYACEWTVPTSGTSDIFSILVTDPACYTHMPSSLSSVSLGSQLPHTGNRFAGIFTYSKGFILHDTSSYREYLQVKLNKEIEPGQKYCGEMYVSLAENSKYASNSIGMWFNGTATITRTYYRTLFYYFPQVVEKKIISDTSNWIRIYREFILDEPAQYVTIGNFYDDYKTQIEVISESNQLQNVAYYYIDDIRVEKLPYDQFITSGNTTLCKGDATELTAFAGVDEVFWTTLEDTSTVIHVGKNFSLTPEADATFRVKSIGCYKTVIDTISIKVNPRPKIELGSDTTLCKGSKLIINSGDGHTAYQWQDQSTNKTFEVTSTGTYWAEVSNNFDCKIRDEIKVDFDDVPKIDLGRDTLLCDGFFPLRAGGNEYTYVWSTGSTDSTYLPTQTGTFWVEASNHCGVAKDTIALYSASDIFIPNVITVNDDQMNDRFEFGVKKESGVIEKSVNFNASLQVFNRWGMSVYAGYPYTNHWPTSYNQIEEGEYYYYVSVPGCRDFKGWVQVIR